jgi:hypothetical protein
MMGLTRENIAQKQMFGCPTLRVFCKGWDPRVLEWK